MEFFNLEDSDVPAARLINLAEDMKKYVPNFSELTSERLLPWIQVSRPDLVCHYVIERAEL